MKFIACAAIAVVFLFSFSVEPLLAGPDQASVTALEVRVEQLEQRLASLYVDVARASQQIEKCVYSSCRGCCTGPP